MTEPSWSEFDRRAADQEQKLPTDDLDAACASVFITAEGKRLLAVLRERYFDAPLGGLADDRALRVRITQQQFVRDLETARDRGLAAAGQRKVK